MSETDQVITLYDNLAPYDESGETVYILSKADGLRYLTVAVAGEPGMAGGQRQTYSEPVRIYPGLNKLSKSYWERVEADAQRQRDRNGGILADMLDRDFEVVRNLAKTSTAKVAEWLMASANIEVVAELRNDPHHGEAARRAFEAWHKPDAVPATKMLRHFWAMSTGSRRVA